MRDKVILIVMVVSLAFNLGVLAIFGTLIIQGRAIYHEGPQIEEDIKLRLGLTPEQEEELGDIRKGLGDEIQPLQQKMEKKRKEAFKLLEEPEMDTKKRDKLFAEIVDLQMQIELAMFNHMYEIKGELTPEQQGIFLEIMEERICPKGGPMGPGRGYGRGRGGPGLHRKGINKPMDKPSNERRNHYEEMEREFEGSPDGGGPGGSRGNSDRGERGNNR